MTRIGACLALAAALAAAGCGSNRSGNAPRVATDREPLAAPAQPPRRPFVVRLRCTDGGTFAPTALTPGWRRRSLVAGPLTFLYARDLARQPAAAFGPQRAILRAELGRARDQRVRRRIKHTLRRTPSGGLGVVELFVLVEPGGAATVVVPPNARGRLALVYSRRARDAERPGAAGIIRLSSGDRAVRFQSCDGEHWHYLGGIIANRPRCVPIDIHTGPGRTLRRFLPLGTGNRRCGRPPPHRRLLLRRAPYLGVRCLTPNSISCDTVALAVWLRAPIRNLTATIDGRTFTLRPPASPNGHWEGTLHPAGLRTPGAALRVTSDRGGHYWAARHTVRTVVHLSATEADGARVSTRVEVGLHPGYG